MDTKRNLLIEIGTEELPPKSLRKTADALADAIVKALIELAVLEDGAAVKVYATPRRLACFIPNVAARQAHTRVEKRGPALDRAYDENGEPTKAAEGFARSCGVAVSNLVQLETDKGSWLVYQYEQPGRFTEDLLGGVLSDAIKTLPVDRRMRWGSRGEEFVRPVHWLVTLFGDEVFEQQLFGIHSDRMSRGHRFHCNKPVEINVAADYEAALEAAFVVVDFDERRRRIVDQASKLARQVNGNVVLEDALLDEVTALVEWPSAIMGQFPAEFLDVPAEALVAAMAGHQKYFHVVDEEGVLMPYFITISNIQSKNAELVQQGNERVLNARLSDARFFWETDCRTSLGSLTTRLDDVVFQQKLGSVGQKSRRISQLASAIAAAIDCSADDAARAGLLCKADLLSEMVGEFPELQGLMGGYYAANDGESETVIRAIRDHYKPTFALDALPSDAVSQAVAIADKLDTLTAIFAIGEIPTGVKDPFALRRATLGIIRIILENDLSLDLRQLVEQAIALVAADGGTDLQLDEQLFDQILDFVFERLRGFYLQRDFQHDEIDAVLSLRPTHLVSLDRRLRAVRNFRRNPDAESLVAANKRVLNMLKKVEFDGASTISEAFLQAPEAKRLLSALRQIDELIAPKIVAGNYDDVCADLATLRPSIDDFFDAVMVMVDDETVRNNRLQLLWELHQLFLKVADLSKLQMA